jgi:hypothetical protein
MALITLFVAIAFTTLYFTRAWNKNPEPLARVTNAMMTHMDKIAKWAALYGLAALILTLLMSYTLGDMLIRLVNNAMICLMALPFIFDKLIEKYQGKVNVAILDEARALVGWISSNEKAMTYIGAVSAAALFLTMFR